jgi:hypothetical protein
LTVSIILDLEVSLAIFNLIFKNQKKKVNESIECQAIEKWSVIMLASRACTVLTIAVNIITEYFVTSHLSHFYKNNGDYSDH